MPQQGCILILQKSIWYAAQETFSYY